MKNLYTPFAKGADSVSLRKKQVKDTVAIKKNREKASEQDSRHIFPVFKKTINKYQPFYFFIFIGGFIMMAVIRLINPSYLRNLFESAVNMKLLMHMFKEGIFGFNITSLLHDVLCIVMLSIGIQIAFFVNNPSFFLWILAFITMAYVLKLIAIQLLAGVFMGRSEAMVHLLLHLFFTRLLGIVLLPLLFVLLYQPFMPVSGALMLLSYVVFIVYLAWLLRLFIQMKIMSKAGFLYLFIYICTIELSPLAILLKDYIRL